MSALGTTAVGVSAVDQEALARDIRATLMPGFEGLTVPEWLTAEYAAGLMGACVYGSNIESREQLRRLGVALRRALPDALIAIDEEGGEVTRLSYVEGSPYPGAAVMGRIDDETYTEEIGGRVAREMLSAGFNFALAPDADVNSNPLNPVIGTRSFGDTPELAARHAAAWIRGFEREGTAACPKHFPGHGDTEHDSHLSLPSVAASRETLLARELPPFRAAFAAGARAVMTSHILLPEIDPIRPATFSPTILGDLLRGELGFTGVVVSDALDMAGASAETGIPEAAVRALAAGCDLLLLGVDTTAAEFAGVIAHIEAAVAAGRLPAARITDAAARVRLLAAGVAPAAQLADTAEPEHPHHADPRAAVTGQELSRIADSFGGTELARGWLREHPKAVVIQLSAEANMAVGVAPWGPFAAAAHPLPGLTDAAAAFAVRPFYRLDRETAGDAAQFADDLEHTGAIVVGRGIHRSGYARDTVDALRAAHIPLLILELGWPDTTTGNTTNTPGQYADLTSYGSSALVGSALLTLIESTTP